MKYHLNVSLQALLLVVQATCCTAIAYDNREFVISPQNLNFREQPSSLPDLHFWTSRDGRPQLDSRVTDDNVGLRADYAPQAANVYGGGVNNGAWRGFTAIAGSRKWVSFTNKGTIINAGPSLDPGIMAIEQQVMRDNDSQAAAGAHPLAAIDLSGSGLRWGAGSNQSYLKGPVTLTCPYIRIDGPVGQIGTDVTLNARRIVIDGVELPPNNWRQALTRMAQPATSQIQQ